MSSSSSLEVFVWIAVVVGCCSFFFAGPTRAAFSPAFADYIRARYGDEWLALLQRTDLDDATTGRIGSYGGGNHSANEKTEKNAVIFVHGMGSNANRTRDLHAYFVANGNYSDGELYATTWGPAMNGSAHCEYVKVVRTLINAVIGFTGRRVSIIARSMGVAITRKALLGGKCVDTGEVLGGPLKGRVETFVSVAGVNWGVPWCECNDTSGATCVTYGNVDYNTSCNMLNGLHCGSAYFDDINEGAADGGWSPAHANNAVGERVLSILSTADDAIGYVVCAGNEMSGLCPNSDAVHTVSGLDHVATILGTVAQQFNYITKHSLV
jgi:hypothetical protein